MADPKWYFFDEISSFKNIKPSDAAKDVNKRPSKQAPISPIKVSSSGYKTMKVAFYGVWVVDEHGERATFTAEEVNENRLARILTNFINLP